MSSPLFDTMKTLWTKEYHSFNELPEEMQTNYSQFMINRFLSSCDYLLPLLSDLSSKRITNQQHYEILLNAVRKMFHRVNYDSYKKEPEDKVLLFALQKEYEIGLREARIYEMELTGAQKCQLKDKWTDCYKYTIET